MAHQQEHHDPNKERRKCSRIAAATMYVKQNIPNNDKNKIPSTAGYTETTRCTALHRYDILTTYELKKKRERKKRNNREEHY